MLLRKDGELATREATFVDDIHPTGRDATGYENTKEACRQLKARTNLLGNQASDRKYRPPTWYPGAWNGCIIHPGTPFLMKSTTAKKWIRFKKGLSNIFETVKTSDVIQTSELRKLAGLGVNVTEVYTDARPYLKGFFNAVEAFRNNRDIDGWRLQEVMYQVATLAGDDALAEDDAPDVVTLVDYPAETRITDELKAHVGALTLLFKGDSARAIPIRPTDATVIRYMVGDLSAEGFGAGTQYPNSSFSGRDGLWDPGFAKGGSKLREATCQDNHLLTEIRAGKHDGCEVWMLTDNAVWSYVWNKGMSTAKHLFSLVIELKMEAREHVVHLKSCHISGDRMIAT